MNGREQMKAARAKALGRVRRPICASHQGQSNKYALELTLIELGASESEAFWATYDRDPMVERLRGRRDYWFHTERGKMRQLKIHIREILSKNGGPLPLP